MYSRMTFRLLLTSSFMAIISTLAWSSDIWKKGYFIDNSGDTTFCLIKDEDWKNNPDQFKWRTSENGETKIAFIDFVSRFMIDSTALYVRDTIQFETSSNKIEQLSTSREAEFESRVTFLKVLVSGQASLYYYEMGDAQRFFFSSPDQPSPEALVYKVYKTDDDEIRQNFRFREQIWKGFKCDEITLKDINELAYERTELVDYFIKINQCLESEFFNYNKFKTQGIFSLNVFLGVNSAPSKLVNTSRNESFNYDLSFPFQAGLEFEYQMPFRNNNWSLFIAPTLTRFKSSTTYTTTGGISGITRSSQLEYLTLDIAIAVRKYFTLMNDKDLFVNAGLVVSYPLESNFSLAQTNYDVQASRNFILGAGYNFNKVIGAEFRWNIQRNLTWGSAFPWRVVSNFYGLTFHLHLF